MIKNRTPYCKKSFSQSIKSPAEAILTKKQVQKALKLPTKNSVFNFLPKHWTSLFNLSGIELYKFWMCTKGIFSKSSWQNAQSWSLILGCFRTSSNILKSGELSGQFSRSSNGFSENQDFERIELCAGALCCCTFLPKNVSGKRLSNLSFHRRFRDISDHRGQ